MFVQALTRGGWEETAQWLLDPGQNQPGSILELLLLGRWGGTASPPLLPGEVALPGTALPSWISQDIPRGLQVPGIQTPGTGLTVFFFSPALWARRREDTRGAGVVSGDGLVLDLPGRQVHTAVSGFY